MTQAERDKFDSLLEEVIESLPPGIAKLLDEMPVIVEDFPADDVLEEFRNADGTLPARDELCGLHSGIAFTDRAGDDTGDLPAGIYMYREGIIAQAGGWEGPEAEEYILDEIEITLLHEIGHQFGLDEDDLERLGYQ
ncbi:MAG: metallopeptidase family protein [Planctomycetes bacterium]|nr:metallopeptidase family protein [Planctomycetota bacterium]